MITDSIIKLSQDLYKFMYDTDYYNFYDNGSSEKNFNEIYQYLISGNVDIINGIISYLKTNINEGVKPERSLLLILRIELLIGKNLYIKECLQ